MSLFPRVQVRYPSKGFCWDKADTATSKWTPQGLTTGTAGGHQAWTVSWHDRGNDQARVTFVDGAHRKYRHVVLADPGKKSDADFKPVAAHAGGIAWVGHYLYVADSGKGVRVFDLNHIWKADGGPRDNRYTLTNGRVHAAGYEYVLPQVGSYTAPDPPSAACQPGRNPFFSSISYDRTSHRLVSGEYCDDQGRGRLVRWPLAAGGLLDNADHETVQSAEWYFTEQKYMQGAATRGDEAVSTSSHGASALGTWHPMDLSGKHDGQTLHGKNDHPTAAPGPEDITFTGGHFWTLTEHPDERFVFPDDAHQIVRWTTTP